MEILGFALALFVGITLGLIGGGGSILAMPILVYIFHINPQLATSYSLFIVGISAFIDNNGRVLSQTPENKKAFLVDQLQLNTNKTFIDRLLLWIN